MTERTDAQYNRHLLVLANLKEGTQVALPVPAEHAFLLLDVVPEHIRGNDGHATIFHLPDFLPPFALWHSRIVYLAHHRTNALPVYHKAIGIPCYRFPEVGSPCSSKHRHEQRCHYQ